MDLQDIWAASGDGDFFSAGRRYSFSGCTLSLESAADTDGRVKQTKA